MFDVFKKKKISHVMKMCTAQKIFFFKLKNIEIKCF